jgi:hypothetical protein
MSNSICNGEPSIKEVYLTHCLNKDDYYCYEGKSDGDHCTNPSFTLYDKNALQEFYEDISFCLKERPIHLNCLKPFINSFQLALYPYKNSENSENTRKIEKDDLPCNNEEEINKLNQIIKEIENSEQTDDTLKTLLITKLNFFLNKINKLCKEKKEGGRRHTKKRNRKQKKTRRSLRSYRY